MQYFLSIIIILIIILVLVSIFIYHRSTLATVAEIVIRLMYKIFNIDEKISGKDEKISKHKFKAQIITDVYEGFKVDTIYKDDDYEFLTIYLHGGSYTNEASYFHNCFVDNLALKLKTKLIMPHYPLSPENTWKECFEFLEKMYKDIINNTDKKIVIMGDSAGGGLALAFTEYLNNNKIKQPDKIVLISPWVDISMSNENMRSLERIDPMLKIDELLPISKSWKGKIDIKDYRVSPLFGELKGLNDILLFTGDREILYPDTMLLYEKLTKSKVNTKLIVGKSMNHIYPLYPIKEANVALKEISEFINK